MDSNRARFESVVLVHLDAAYRLARWLAPSASDADDVVQEAVLRAYRSFASLRGAEAKPWLLAIVRNCHWTAARQRRGYVPLPDDDEAPYNDPATAVEVNPEVLAIQSEAKRMLDDLIAGLRVEYREILILREIEEMNYREIAAVIGVPIGTVMSRLARARAALKSQWLGRESGATHEPS